MATDREEVIPCGLVIRSIGYRGVPIGDVPFDERRGLIRNVGGRMSEEDGTVQPGQYVAGLDQARPERRDRHEQEVRVRVDRR